MQKRILHLAISALLTAVLLIAVLSETSLEQFLSILGAVKLELLLVYALLSLTGLLLRTWRYQFVLKEMLEAPPRFSQVLLVTAVRNALVDFFPARLGELSYFYFLNRFGVRITTTISSFGFCFVFDLVALAFIIVLALGFEGSLQSVLICLFVFVLLCLLISVLDRIALSLAKQLPASLSKHLESIAGDLTRVRSSFVKILLITFGLRLAKYLSLYVLLLAVVAQWGIESLNPLLSILAFVAAEAAASLPISGLMSFGAYEGAWSAVMEIGCGAPCESIPVTTVSFAVHLITQAFGYSIGLLALLLLFVLQLLEKRALES